MSTINSQGGLLIDCRECDSPDCRGCNIYTLATALGQGKLNWMTDEKHCVHVPDMSEGEWIIEDRYLDHRTERCSKCGMAFNRDYIQMPPRFCSWCGSPMKPKARTKEERTDV